MNESVDQSQTANDGKEAEPPPENQEDLVVDDVESKDAEGIDSLLLAPSAPPPVVARGYPWEGVTHGINHARHSLFLSWKKVILPNIVAISREPSVEKSVGYEELKDNNEQIENFTKYESTEVYIVSILDIVTEEADQPLKFLFRIINLSCCCSLTKEFHEATFIV